MRSWVVFVALGILGLGLFFWLEPTAFPHAAVKLQVTRGDALNKARAFLEARQFDLQGYDSAIAFHDSPGEVVYLEQNMPVAEAQKVQREVGSWAWGVRFFKPLEKREYRVEVAPDDGRILSFGQALSEDAKGDRIGPEQAQKLAEDFVRLQGIDLGGYKLIGSSKKDEKERTDHYFTWERQGWQAGEAKREVRVTVQGSQVGAYNGYSLHVPERFNRELEKTTSFGTLYTVIALLFGFVLLVASLVWFILLLRQGEVGWRLPLGAAVLVAFLTAANGINTLSGLKMAYPTTFDYTVYIAIVAIVGAIALVLQASTIALSGTAGEGLSRQVFGQRSPTLTDFSWSKLAGARFAASAVRGYCVAAMMLGYAVLFYTLGRKYLGVYMPSEPSYDNTLGGPFPFLAPLGTSLLAALWEEFTFRFLAIPLMKKWLRWTPAAIVVPAIIWAFAHSSYPVFPMYVRGIELTIVGSAFGLLYLYYDIETTIVAHYVYDAALIASPLLSSHSPYYVVSGAAVVLLAAVPALLAGIGALRRRSTEGAGSSGLGA